jgi:hypothetical protein
VFWPNVRFARQVQLVSATPYQAIILRLAALFQVWNICRENRVMEASNRIAAFSD